jgi:signal transduction histidine kinase/ActR/RegA family two-component response regulator
VLYSIIHDITERKRLEDELKESEQKHRTLFAMSLDALNTLEPPTWQFTSANLATINLFGTRDETDFMTQAPWHYSPERQPDGRSSHEKAQEMIAIAMRDGNHFFEWTHKRVSGEEFFATVMLMRMDIKGKLFLQATIRDISAQKKIELEKSNLQAQLLHSEKLATVGTLAAGIAHEINNPLTVVKGFTQRLASRLDTVDPRDENKKTLNTINGAIDRIAAIVNGLRTYARADTDHVESVNIHKTIGEVLSFIRQITKNADVEIRQDLVVGTPYVRCNFGKIQQVLVNLLNNACDALQARPADRQITISTLSDDKQVTILLSDNGPGIPKAILEKIFDPFFTTKEVGKGTGLGLSISRSIIESFGGSFRVSSKEGEGATFHITLPRIEPPAASTCDADTDKKELSIPRLRGDVLVIDDEPGLCALLKDHLEEAGLTVTTMGDPAMALEIMARKRFDLIITDMQMPGLTGVTLIKRAREIELQAGTRFVVITGGITTSYTKADRDYLRETIQGYLTKPWEQEKLLELVGSLLPSSQIGADEV